MNGIRAFARKETVEILRTWRLYVLPGILLVFAATGPLLAKYTPEIIGSLAGAQLGGVQLPDPVVFDAYGQWVKNLGQIGLFAIIIMYGGIVSAEHRSGTAVLVLTKPVSRSGFVVAKAVVHALFVCVVTVVGTLITWAVTAVVFGEAPAGALWSSAMVWLALAVFFVAFMVLFSTLLSSAAGAAGLGIALFAVIGVAGIWHPAAENSPAGLLSAAGELAYDHPVDSLAVQLIVTAVLAVAAVAAACAVFTRREL